MLRKTTTGVPAEKEHVKGEVQMAGQCGYRTVSEFLWGDRLLVPSEAGGEVVCRESGGPGREARGVLRAETVEA